MNWVEILFAFTGGACLTVGLVHLFVWLHQRRQWSFLCFSLAAFSAAAIALFELLLLHAASPEEYGHLLRLIHAAICVFLPAILGFIWLDLRAGWIWLAVLAVAFRVAALAANFLGGDNASFVSILELRNVEAWGIGPFARPVGVPNPWIILGQASTFFGLAFLASVLWSVLRRADAARKRRALAICGSVTLTLFLSVAMMWLLILGQLPFPLALSLTMVPVIMAMGYILGRDVVSSSLLSRELLVSQHKLRESEQRMQVAMAAADIGVWTWNLDDDTFWVSDIGSRISGAPPDTRLPRAAVQALIHRDDLQTLGSAREQAVNGSGEYAVELRRVLPDGRVRWIAARGRAEREHADAPLLLRGVVVDITERHESEERLKRVVDGAPVGMMVCGPDGRIVLANHRAHQVFSYPPAGLSGLHLEQLLPAGALPGFFANGAAVARDALAMAPAHELAGRRQDGGQVAVEVAFTSLEINDAQHVLVSVANISGRKLMELEHSQQREELAHLSRVSLLGELSGSLAHELNQPLTAVLSNAQAALRFLAHEPPNLAEVQESLVHIVENDKRASEVIRRLRAMLRKEPLDHQPLSVNDVVHDVLKLMNSDLLGRRVPVTLDLAAGLPVILGDRVQLQQVLLNLVINACDAMRDTGGERSVCIRSRLDPGAGIELSVSDLGHGVPPEDLERIFTPFVTTKAEGIGLGLAICRTIVQAHRGRLWASNNAGPGATLHFTLPVLAQPPGDAGAA